jgi:hypothetical protein
MLRESALAFEYDLDVRAVRDPAIPSGVPGGKLLLRLVDSLLVHSEPPSVLHAEIIEELGAEALVDAASVFGNFQMMNRVADATGIPVSAASIERERDLIEMLDLDALQRR